ncbi:molybdopterin biosynthesis MoaE protein [Enterobacter hormaechei]|nr:molybdopterin biosynthesis MoaE protein [Enterobacter hormaechei]
MIKVLFFAQVRELVNTDSLTLDGAFENVAALRAHLAAQGDRWALALDEGKLLAAVNQTLVELTHPLADGTKWPSSRRSQGVKMTETRILVGHERFNVGTEYDWLAGRDEDGAVVTFTGKVRNHNLGDSVKALTLEHYPGMTEKSLAAIVEEARGRWPLGRVTVIHRIGEMWPGEEIVFVGVTSAHRGSAFAAGEFIMDYLKTKAPFWKREATPEGERWVESRDSDKQAASRW